MIRITKRERDYLIEKGCKYGKDLHSTLHKRTYATESRKVKDLLKQLYNK